MLITGGNFVQALHALVHVVLDSCESGHDGGGAEAVSDHGEVGEVSLDARVQDGLRVGVAERRPVLVEELHQLVTNIPEIDTIQKYFSGENILISFLQIILVNNHV